MIIARSKNTISGSFWGLVYRIVATLFPFIIRTIIIKEFGSDYLGLNSLFSSILHVLNLSELGLSTAITYSMYKPIAEDDYSTMSALLKLYKKLYIIIGTTILILGLLLLPFLEHLINGTYPEDINIYFFFLIYLANTCVSYFFFAYKECLLSAYQRNDILNIVKLIMHTSQFVIQIIVLLVLRDYYLFAFAMVVFTLLRGYVNSVIATKLYPQIVCEGTVSKETKGEIKKNVSGIAISKVCSISRGSSNSIIISSFLSLTALAIFDNYFYIITAVSATMIVFETSVVAGVGNSIVLETKEKNYKDYCKINFLYLWIAGWLSSFILCLYQPFMELWVGKGLMLSDYVMVLFCIYFFVGCFSSITNVYSTATGLWWEQRYKSLFEVIMNVVSNIIFIQIFGMEGILYATILTLFFITFYWTAKVLYKHYFSEEKVSDIIKIIAKETTVVCVTCALTYTLCLIIKSDNLILNMVLRFVICLLLPNIIFYLIMRKDVQMQNALVLLKQILRLNKNED